MDGKKTTRKKLRTLKPITQKLREENRSNEDFELMINELTFEELIQLKLEVSSKLIYKHKMYGFPLWKVMPYIAKEAMLRFVYNNVYTLKDMSGVLGITMRELRVLILRYRIRDLDN